MKKNLSPASLVTMSCSGRVLLVNESAIWSRPTTVPAAGEIDFTENSVITSSPYVKVLVSSAFASPFTV